MERVITTTHETAQIRVVHKAYLWMACALFVTAFVSLFTVSTPSFLEWLFSNRFIFFGLLFGELGLVIFLSARINRLAFQTAFLFFMLYAVLNGITLSPIFLLYTTSSLATTFFATAGMYGVVAGYGYITDKDLTTIGSISFMGLIGILLATVLNIFFKSPSATWLITYIGILVFCGLTAYDTQKLKSITATASDNPDAVKKYALLGALALYLDFINLFLFILRIFGRRRK